MTMMSGIRYLGATGKARPVHLGEVVVDQDQEEEDVPLSCQCLPGVREAQPTHATLTPVI